MAWTLWLAPLAGAAPPGHWLTPGDLWRTFAGADLLVHGHLSSLYGGTTTLVTLPGVLVLLAPVAAVVSAAGLGLGVPFTHLAHPSGWLVLGPASVGLCCPALFALDGWARRLAVPVLRRWVLALVQLVIVWNVAAQWGHPEDCLAVAGLLWSLAAAVDGRSGAAGWWLGAACALQPLVLLAAPVVLAVTPAGRRLTWAARVALVPALTLVVPLVANWRATVHAVVDQPNYPTVDHPTPWIALAPRLPGQAVAAGPGRLVALAVAVACFVPVRSAWAGRRGRRWAAGAAGAVLWWGALTLGLRGAFESVMVAYYLWPPLALAVVVAASRRLPLAAAAAAAVATSVFANLDLHWQGRWSWWAVTTAGTAAALAASWWAATWPGRPGPEPAAADRPAADEVGDCRRWT